MGFWKVSGGSQNTGHYYFTGQCDWLYFFINMAIAGNLHVDLMEVMRISITHNPLFYLILCAVAWVKVDIWKWLFSDLQSEQNQPI